MVVVYSGPGRSKGAARAEAVSECEDSSETSDSTRSPDGRCVVLDASSVWYGDLRCRGIELRKYRNKSAKMERQGAKRGPRDLAWA